MERMSYAEAVAQLEKIVLRMEDPNLDIAEVKGLIEKGKELMELCKGELEGYEEEFKNIQL